MYITYISAVMCVCMYVCRFKYTVQMWNDNQVVQEFIVLVHGHLTVWRGEHDLSAKGFAFTRLIMNSHKLLPTQ